MSKVSADILDRAKEFLREHGYSPAEIDELADGDFLSELGAAMCVCDCYCEIRYTCDRCGAEDWLMSMGEVQHYHCDRCEAEDWPMSIGEVQHCHGRTRGRYRCGAGDGQECDGKS